MYNVIQNICNAKHIYVRNSIFDMNSPKEMIDKTKLSIHTCGDSVYNPCEKYNKECDNFYNNVEVYGLPKGKLTILQDYGNGDYEDENFETISDLILFGGIDSPSLGYYDGYLCYIVCDRDNMQIYKICKHEPININDVRQKRPFSCAFGFDKNDENKNKRLKFEYNINFVKTEGEGENWNINYYNEHNIVDIEEEITYSQIICPKQFNETIEAISYNTLKNVTGNEMLDYISDSMLVSLGFSYDSSTNTWSYKDIIIKEEVYDFYNRFFYLIENDDEKPKPIFTSKDIPLTKELKNKLKIYKMS